MAKKLRKSFFLAPLLCALLVTACIETIKTHGYVFDEVALKGFKKGSTGKEEILRTLGSPSASSSFGEEVWYYISTKTSSVAFLEPEIIEQNITAIIFTNGTLKDIRRYTVDDKKKLAYIDEITKTGGVKLTVFEQLIGNVGKFNPDDLKER